MQLFMPRQARTLTVCVIVLVGAALGATHAELLRLLVSARRLPADGVPVALMGQLIASDQLIPGVTIGPHHSGLAAPTLRSRSELE
jgi:hypothetical protein